MYRPTDDPSQDDCPKQTYFHGMYPPPAYSPSAPPAGEAIEGLEPGGLTGDAFWKNLAASTEPEFVQTARDVHAELKKNGLLGHKAQVAVVLDISASMQNPNEFFHARDGSSPIKALLMKALATAVFFDDNDEIEIFPFGDKAFGVEKLSVKHYKNINSICESILKKHGLRKETNYGAPMAEIRNYYFKNTTELSNPIASELPVFTLFATDGECNEWHQQNCLRQAKNASYLPIFFKFLCLRGKQDPSIFKFIQDELDDAPVRGDSSKRRPEIAKHYMDNSDLVVVDRPEALSVGSLLREYGPYLYQAYYQKNLLTAPPGLAEDEVRRLQKSADRRGEVSARGHDHADGDYHPAPVKPGCCTIL